MHVRANLTSGAGFGGAVQGDMLPLYSLAPSSVGVPGMLSDRDTGWDEVRGSTMMQILQPSFLWRCRGARTVEVSSV